MILLFGGGRLVLERILCLCVVIVIFKGCLDLVLVREIREMIVCCWRGLVDVVVDNVVVVFKFFCLMLILLDEEV